MFGNARLHSRDIEWCVEWFMLWSRGWCDEWCVKSHRSAALLILSKDKDKECHS